MDKYTLQEIAYKNGYRDGRENAVKHGRWVRHSVKNRDGRVASYCSECGMKTDNESKYCGNCGAKMDDVEKSES